MVNKSKWALSNKLNEIYGKDFGADKLTLLRMQFSAEPLEYKATNKMSFNLNKTNDDIWISKCSGLHSNSKNIPFVICFIKFLAFNLWLRDSVKHTLEFNP